MKIGVIGAGRLGICFALLCEQAGYDVLVSDVRERYVKNLQNKIISTNEPEVAKLLTTSPRLSATPNNLKVIRECDIIYTLVATPSLKDGSYDVSAVWKVVEDLKKAGKKNVDGKAFVVGCTTNPGDCEEFQKELDKYGVDVFYNPEFIAQGTIIRDLCYADMVLVGGSGKHIDILNHIYEKIQEGHKDASVQIMSTKAAELTKIAVNCFLTTKVSYANQVGQVMIKSGMEDEVKTVLRAIGSDDRIGRKYLGFGFGFGGPCFPRDNRAFAAYTQQVGVHNSIGETTDDFNNEHSDFLFDYYVNKNKEELPFCFKYLTYKQGVDIMTESRPYDLALALLEEGYKVYCLDDTMSTALDDRIIFAAPTENVCWIDL